MTSLGCRLLAALAMSAALLGIGASSALAEGNFHLDPEQFAIESFTTSTSDMTAGSHPDVGTAFTFKSEPIGVENVPYGRVRLMEFDLPPGLVGDPTNFPTCTRRQFLAYSPECPLDSQVGVTAVWATGLEYLENIAVYNLERGPEEPVVLAVKVATALYAYIRVKVRPNGDLVGWVDGIPMNHPLTFSDLTLWGVPADHNGSGAARLPFMAASTECQTVPKTTMRAFSYEGKLSTADSLLSGPLVDCANVPFEPTMSAVPTDRVAGAPTGLDVEIAVPQGNDPDGRATAHVRDVEIALPEGMSVSPSSANGLGACSPAEFGYRDEGPATCPDSSKLGTLTVETPVLDEPLTGSLYLAKQNDNPFGSLLALYIELEGTGQRLKLAGRVDPDPSTGRLTTTFSDNPQLPFERMTVKLKSGPRAPLVNPKECGTYQSETRIVGWTEKAVSASTPMTIDEGCQPLGFAPAFQAGTGTPLAGRSSAFTLDLSRGDRDRELHEVAVRMPEGLIGAIAEADQCPAAAAAAGTCGAGSRIGSVTATSGAGPTPFRLPGGVFLTGPYKGAPFGLSMVVPAVAGPFDLGTVVVRSAIRVDPETAAVSVVSDPLPAILKGIPVQLRAAEVVVDRPGFVLNPTDCRQTGVAATIAPRADGSPVSLAAGEIGYATQGGPAVERSSRFQVSGCGALKFRPGVAMRLLGKGRTRTGTHPALRAVVTQAKGQANIGSAQVTLPRSVVLDARNSYDPKLVCDYDRALKADCPASSVIGKATARTPVLNRPLTGKVHLVQGIKFGPTGNRIRTTPSLLVKLRGEVDVNLRARTTVRGNRLVTIFPKVPDAPVSRFEMRINGGRKGILVVTRTKRSKIDVCDSRQIADAALRGQNGRWRNLEPLIKTPCPTKRPRGKR